MSKRSRKSVQYSQRKLAKEFDVELFQCNSVAAIDRFLDDAIAVSKKDLPVESARPWLTGSGSIREDTCPLGT